MTRNEKAIAALKMMQIKSFEKFGIVFIHTKGIDLALSDTEVMFQEKNFNEYYKMQTEK